MPTDSTLTVEECAREIKHLYSDWWNGRNASGEWPDDSEIETLIRRTQPQWIDVREKLPEKVDMYLVCTHGVIHSGAFQMRKGTLKFAYGITHWQPLPEPPRER